MNGQLRILHLEDSGNDAELIAAKLREDGISCSIDLVETREDYAQRLAAGAFDVIIADYALPSFDGLSALLMVRERDQDMPFIFVSGTIGEDKAVETFKNGATDYVLKGHLSRLVPSIHRALKEKDDRAERRRAVEALRESSSFNQQIIAGAGEGIIVYGQDLRYQVWNPFMEQLTGLSAGDVLGKHPLDVFPFLKDVGVMANLDRSLSGETPPSIDFQFQAAHGTRWLTHASAPMKNFKGEIIGVIATVQDITIRKRTAENLQRLNRTLLARSKSSKAMMSATDEAWFLDEVCRIIVEDCGHALVWIGFAEQDEGRTVRPVAHAGFEEGYLESLKVTWSDSERGRGPVGTAIRTGKPSVFNNIRNERSFAPWRDAAVKRGYAAVIGVPLLADGKAYGSLNIYSRDDDSFSDDEVQLLNDLAADLSYGIAAIRMRSAQAKAESALRENETRLRTLLQTIPDLVWLKDANGTFLACNPMLERLLGSGEADIIGKTDYDFVSRELADFFREHDRKAMAAGKPSSNEEWVTFADDGHRALMETIKTPMYDAGGYVTGVLGIARDITKHRQLEAQYLQAQKMESIGTLAGGIAHDFNNILSAIIGYGHVTLMKMAGDDPQRSNIEHMLEAADRATYLTKSLLLFSRKQIAVRKPMDLNEVVRKVEKFMVRVIGEDIECKTLLYDNPVPILADGNQLEQVLMNFAINARDAMPDGGSFNLKTARIELTEDFIRAHGYGTAGPYAMITVSDTGVGMDEATQKRIFEPFFTTKEVGKGTGLGLAVVYGIVKGHEGLINVYSEPGKGTTFRIYLPIIGAVVKEETKAQHQEAPARGTETVLVAEDDDNLRKLSLTVLAEFGYTVIEAVDGEDAVKKFMENKDAIRLLLFDLIMPKMNGKEASDEIRKIKPDLKILFASGYDPDLLQQKELLEAGVNLVYKPISPMDLLRKVRSVLDGVA
jgi:PAS domain S-box-containing protein